MLNRSARLLVLLTLNTSAAALAAADPQSPSGIVITDTQDETVVVTARRREEQVQDVPIAVAAVSGTSLQQTGSNNVAKLQQLVPSFQFYSTNPRNSAANIRGLGAPFGLTNDGIEQGVGVYVDQVYNSRVAATTFDFVDVERVEILRGPQGTLYGKNTTAGAVNITTRPPSFTPEGRVELSFGNLDYVQAKGSVSGPLVDDKVAVRLAASATQRRGTIFNVATDRWVNEQDNLGFRGSLLWNATDALHLTLSGDYSRQNPECCAQIFVRVGRTQRPLNRQYDALAAAFGYEPPSRNAFDRLTDLDTPLDARQELGGVSLRAEWELGPGTLTSVSAWRFWNWGPSNDRDFTGLPVTTVSANPSKQNQYSQEFRYSVEGTHLDYTIGLFAYHQKQQTTGAQEQGPAASRWTLNPGNVPVGSSGCATPTTNACNPAVLDGLRSENDILLKSTSIALFGQLAWHVTDRLTLQPGLRVNYDKKSGSYVATVTNSAGVAIVCNPVPASSVVRDQCATLAPQSYAPRFSDWNVSGDFTVSYKAADDVLAYATYAKSYKSGGINLSGLPLDANNLPVLSVTTVKPEDVDHVELGLKTQLLDRRMTFNLAGFWTEIRNYQALVNSGAISTVRGYLANAQKVRVRGIEADLSWRASDRFNLYANGAFTDHKYVKFTGAPCPPELSGGGTGTPIAAPGTPGNSPVSCDISGQWLPGISKWAFSYGAEYNLPAHLLGQEGEVYLGFDGSYRSKFSSNPSRSIYMDVNGYALSNFRLGFRTDKGWNVFGWVRNAFDTHYYELLAITPGSTGLIAGQPGDPRTYGVTLSARF
jgi:iron complex outermembrane receptor protein